MIEKIKKMQAMYSEGSGTEEAEAQAFAAAVHRMVTEHKIGLTELEMESLDTTDPISVEFVPISKYIEKKLRVRTQRVKWMEDLATLVAQNHYCFCYIAKGTSRVAFMGRRSDREAAEEMYLFLAKSAESIADREYVKFFKEMDRLNEVERARGFRISFLRGFVQRLTKKYWEVKTAMLESQTSSGTAVARIKSAWDAVAEFRDKYNSRAGKTGKMNKLSGSKAKNADGFMRGQEAADKLAI